MAYEFDGAGDHISFTKGAGATDLTTFSVSYNYIRDTMTGYREVYWSGGVWDDSFGHFVQHDTAGYMVFCANWSGNTPRWSIANPDTNWHNEVITYDYSSSSAPVWYRDGSTQTVTTQVAPSGSGEPTKDTTALRIGAYSDGSGEYWDGKIAEFAIWNRILTAGEASILGDGFSPLFIPNGLVFYAPLIRSTPDFIGGGTGTVTNAVVFNHPKIIYPKVAPLIFTSTPAYINAELHRWRDDNGSETTASWLTTAGNNINRAIDTNTRLRFIMSASGNPNAAQFQLEYRKKGTADPWKKVV